MGMPGQGMATAGAPVKERDQKGPTVANGAGKGWDVRRKDRAPSRGQGLRDCGGQTEGQGFTQGFVKEVELVDQRHQYIRV